MTFTVGLIIGILIGATIGGSVAAVIVEALKLSHEIEREGWEQ